MASLLDTLRNIISVDCDTLDASVAASLGPFIDCTSNQAIAVSELANSKHGDLVQRSILRAKELHSTFEDATVPELAVDIMTIDLHVQTLPHLTGRVHVQVDPFKAFSTAKTISHAERIVRLAALLHPPLVDRICIKIPSTWEGLTACRHLEAVGIRTLATTLFNTEQAALAAHVKCTYIAPYVNELKVHFVPDYRDPDPGFAVVHAAKLHYQRIGAHTQVMPASLTSVAEILALVGKADRITIAPHLLRELASMPASSAPVTTATEQPSGMVPAEVQELADRDDYYAQIVADEHAFRTAMARSKDGADERKLNDAIAIFCEAQTKLTGMVDAQLAASRNV